MLILNICYDKSTTMRLGLALTTMWCNDFGSNTYNWFSCIVQDWAFCDIVRIDSHQRGPWSWWRSHLSWYYTVWQWIMRRSRTFGRNGFMELPTMSVKQLRKVAWKSCLLRKFANYWRVNTFEEGKRGRPRNIVKSGSHHEPTCNAATSPGYGTQDDTSDDRC